MRLALVLSTVVIGVSGCTKSSAPPETPEQTKAALEAKLVQKGNATYLTTCTACHNSDPSLDGPVGPAIADSSRELINSRIMTGTYPTGYTPKRTTHVMPQFPQLQGEVDGLAAYLNSGKWKK